MLLISEIYVEVCYKKCRLAFDNCAITKHHYLCVYIYHQCRILLHIVLAFEPSIRFKYMLYLQLGMPDTKRD